MGNVVGNRVTYLKVTIFQGETDKTKVWEETHVVQSNENGRLLLPSEKM
jgi:ribosomal protein L21E